MLGVYIREKNSLERGKQIRPLTVGHFRTGASKVFWRLSFNLSRNVRHRSHTFHIYIVYKCCDTHKYIDINSSRKKMFWTFATHLSGNWKSIKEIIVLLRV